MKSEIRYLDVRGVEKFFFLEPCKLSGSKRSRDKVNNKRSMFKNNYS